MENRGTVEQTLNAGEKYTIQPGYYSEGAIKAKTLKEQTDGDALAGDILKGKIAYVDGSKIQGTMTNNSGETVDASNITRDSGYIYLTLPNLKACYDGTSKIRCQDSGIANMKKEVKNGRSVAFSSDVIGVVVVKWQSQYVSDILDLYWIDSRTMMNSNTSDLKINVSGKNVSVSSARYDIRNCEITCFVRG